MSIRWLRPRPDRSWRKACAALGVLVLAAVEVPASAQTPPRRVVLYAAVGSTLTQFDVDVEHATLTKRGSLTLPANAQEGWQHPSKPLLYLAWSDRNPGTGQPSGGKHGLTAFAVDPASGALRPHGQAVTLGGRAIHVTVDVPGEHVLVAYNEPAALTVHQIKQDGTIGAEVKPASPLSLGIYPHFVRVDPSNNSVVLVSRGNNPTATKAEDPGSIHSFTYRKGVLANLATIAPNGGFGFQSRHIDFHPSGRWMFLTLERQNKLLVFPRSADGALGTQPLFSKDTVSSPGAAGPGQTAASIHMHPNGRFIYVSNRAGATKQVDGRTVFAGGENAIAVFQINQTTGEPTLIQSADTRGFTPRTFAVDPSGRLLVVANQVSMPVHDGAGVRTVPGSLAVFKIQGDGKLEYVTKHDLDVSADRALFWTGLVSLP